MLKVENLSFRYEASQQPAVNQISFEVKKGEVLGFLGPNGAGKSTTQKILIGLLKNYQGKVEVLGTDLKHWGQAYYEKIGVSFEMPNHFQKLTGLENLEFFRSLYQQETREPVKLLEMVGLEKDGQTKVANYSKGMQMRLNIARALLNRPELLFFDEPTSGLDPVSARNIKDMILAEKDNGHTVFLTTHNMQVADELCDRVAFIVEGKIALIDNPQKLKIMQGERVVAVSHYKGLALEHQEFPLEGLGENSAFLETIRNHKIQTIHTKESTLEDVFIQVTGRKLL